MIDDTYSAMKVGTDALLLGAWADVSGAQSVLDIGTGCGILALMACQRSQAKVDAIEIEENAASQALLNVNTSPWPHRIRVIATSLQQFIITSGEKYDHILCNPPFYNKALKTQDASRTLARHDDSLPVSDLMLGISCLIKASGKASLVVPLDNLYSLKMQASLHGLFLSGLTTVIPKAGKRPKRVLAEFSCNSMIYKEQSITLLDENGNFTSEYQNLTREFHTIF